MGDNSPTYELQITEKTPNLSFNPDSLKRRPYEPEPSYLESTQYHERVLHVVLTKQQFELVKKAVLEQWA
jgi:hypothetical protein